MGECNTILSAYTLYSPIKIQAFTIKRDMLSCHFKVISQTHGHPKVKGGYLDFSPLTELRNIYTTQNLLRITFSFNDLMLKTNRLKKDFFYKDRLIFGLDDPVANMSIRYVYYA